MASPSTNPSSCDSSIDCAAPSSCSTEPIKPSSNQQYTNTLDCSSPALAQAVPGADPNLPEASGPKIWFTTAMANQAAEDLAQGKARNVLEWYEQYKQRIAEEDRLRNQQNQQVNNENQNSQNNDEIVNENKPKKRRLEDEPGPSNIKDESNNEERIYETLGEQNENPLRQMEIMANSTVFKSSAKISEVAAENQSKRERISKNITNAENVPNTSLTPATPFTHPYGPIGSSPSFAGPSPYPFPYPFGFPVMPPMPYQGMAPGRLPNGYYGNYPGWPMPPHRVFAERAAQSGQIFPPSYGNIPFPPNYFFGYPPHAIPPGPLSGPPLSQASHFAKPATGPLTAPIAASGSMMTFDGKTPSVNNPMDQQASSKSHPTPLFSFSMEPPSHHSPLFQDLSNKHPI